MGETFIGKGNKKNRSPSLSSSSSSDYSLDSSTSTVSMPPSPDGGYGWIIVLSSFLTMLISDGFAFSFGVLYSELLVVFQESKSVTSWIPSLFYGIPLICGPISSALATKFGCRKVQIFGGLLAFGGVFASTFANSVPMLCITVGIIAGLGMSMGYVTSVVMVAFYFEKKRALATGLAVCGSGIGTFVFAPFIELLIKSYTWRGSFLVLSGVTLNLVVCGALLRPLKFTPQEQWRRKLETFEKMSKTISRSISKSSFNEPSRSRHASNTDELDSDEDIHIDVEQYSHSQVQLPTYIKDHSRRLPEQLFVEADRNGTQWHHILRPYNSTLQFNNSSLNEVGHGVNHSESLNLNTSNDLPLKQNIASTAKKNGMTSYSIWQRNHQRKRRQIVQYYPIYRKDVFYRGNLMKLPQFQIRSTSCPELTLGATDDGDESSDDEDVCNAPSLLKLSKHMKRFFKTMFDLAILKNPIFLLFLFSNFILYFWYDVPYVFIVDRAKETGISETDASFIVSVLGIVNTVGQILYGIIGDKEINLSLFYGISTGLAGLSIFLVPFFESYTSMCVLAGFYGFFISANYALSTVILVEYLGMDKLTNAYGITMLMQGIANLIGPPVAGKLYDVSGSYNHTFYAGGGFIVMSGLLLIFVPLGKAVKRWTSAHYRKKTTKKIEEQDSGVEDDGNDDDDSSEDGQQAMIKLIVTEIETVV